MFFDGQDKVEKKTKIGNWESNLKPCMKRLDLQDLKLEVFGLESNILF